MTNDLKVTFADSGREPKCAPNPEYPNGQEVDLSFGGQFCIAKLPYPAPRCGLMVIHCEKCGLTNAVTVAGRPDDPHTVKMGCMKATYSRGKLDAHDEGDLAMVVTEYQNTVRFDFGKKIKWFALPPDMALEFAQLIIIHATGIKERAH